MLHIRAQQIKALATARFDQFVLSETSRLGKRATAEKSPLLPDETWIRDGIAIGRTHGMETEDDFARFNDLRLDSAGTFPTPRDLAVLQQDDLWGWQKLDEIEGRMALESR